MKWWMPGGLSVVLWGGVVGANAEELQWRPAGSAPSRPILVRANLEDPLPPAAVKEGPEIPVFRPVTLDRPTPLVRAQKADVEVSRPLPAGPVLLFAQDKKDTVQIVDPKKSAAKPLVEIIPIQPRTLKSAPPPATIYGNILDNPYAMAGPTYLGGGDIMGDCGPCAMNACDACECCCMQRPHMWFRGEYLLWKMKGDNIPALVTSGTPQSKGRLGFDGTDVLLDGSNFDNPLRSGGRFTFGFWFPRHDCLGLEISAFFLNSSKQTYSFGERDGAIITRPFTDVSPITPDPNNPGSFFVPPFQNVQLVVVPGIVNGTVKVDHYTQLWGAEINLRNKLWCNPCSWLDLTYGYRHAELRENLTIRENLTTDPAIDQFGVSHSIRLKDQFQTRNYFNGGQVGLEGEYRFLPRWSVTGFAKVGLGNVRQVVQTSGSYSFDGVPTPGGLLAIDTNSGRFERNRFAVMPEGGLRINYDLTDHLRLYVGYNFLYMSSVVRPGEQIDTTVNSTFLFNGRGFNIPKTGEARPAVLFKTSDFWAQGVNFGMEYHW